MTADETHLEYLLSNFAKSAFRDINIAVWHASLSIEGVHNLRSDFQISPEYREQLLFAIERLDSHLAPRFPDVQDRYALRQGCIAAASIVRELAEEDTASRVIRRLTNEIEGNRRIADATRRHIDTIVRARDKAEADREAIKHMTAQLVAITSSQGAASEGVFA